MDINLAISLFILTVCLGEAIFIIYLKFFKVKCHECGLCTHEGFVCDLCYEKIKNYLSR